MKNKHIYEMAIMSQDACNLSGMAHSLVNEVLPALREEQKAGDWPADTDNLNQHPVVMLLCHQMAFLSSGHTPECEALWFKNYDYCQKVAAGEQVPA